MRFLWTCNDFDYDSLFPQKNLTRKTEWSLKLRKIKAEWRSAVTEMLLKESVTTLRRTRSTLLNSWLETVKNRNWFQLSNFYRIYFYDEIQKSLKCSIKIRYVSRLIHRCRVGLEQDCLIRVGDLTVNNRIEKIRTDNRSKWYFVNRFQPVYSISNRFNQVDIEFWFIEFLTQYYTV